jgi:hypothetical protein
MSASLSWMAWCSADRLAEGPALLRIGERVVERAGRDAHAARGDVDAAQLQPADGVVEAAALLTPPIRLVGRHAVVVEDELRGIDGPVAELLQLAADGEARPLLAMSRLMPLWRGWASGSVFTSSAKQEPSTPLVIQVLVPFTT